MAQITDWLSQSYRAASKPLNSSRAVNCFAEIEEQDAKSKAPVAVWGSPGTSPFAMVTELATLGANIMNDVLYVVGVTSLWQINPDGSVVNLGAQGAQGQISIDNNGQQLVWVDGVTGWVYQVGGIAQPLVADAAAGATSVVAAITGTITNGDTLNIQLANGSTFSTTATATVGPGTSVSIPLAAALPSAADTGNAVQDVQLTLAQITDPNFFPSSTVTYFDGYFAFVRNGTKEFFLSPLFGIAPFDGSLFASKEATSDLLLAIANSHEQLYLFGQKRIETWYDAGNAPPTFPFQRSDGALIQRGLGAIASIVLQDNTIFWLGEDGMYYRLEGFLPVAVSNRAVEYQWSTYQTRSDCFAFTYTLWGHKMIVLTFPGAKATWELDLSTKRWHERESWIGTNADTSIGRWRPNWAIEYANVLLLGDSQSGQIQQLNENVYTEFGDTIRLQLIGPPFHLDRKRIFMRRFEVDMETGVGLPQAAHLETLQYCMRPVTLTKPTMLTSAAPLPTLPANYGTAALSVWLNVADADATGMLLTSGGLSLAVQNRAVGSPQITLGAVDANGATIVSATYDFLAWTGWVNLLISIDTAAQKLQIWANTLNGALLVETELTPISLIWSSANAISGAGAWQISVI